MKLKGLAAAVTLTAAAGGIIAAASVPAGASGTSADGAPATSKQKAVTAQASVNAAAACWTTFNPPAPEGAPLDQTYKNCNPSAIYVQSGYIYQGQVNLGGDINCIFVPVGGTVNWHWPSTQPGAQYTTVNCRYPA